MGKSTEEIKKYVDISGFNIHQANRGNAALSYGAISFLEQKGLLKDGQELIRYRYYVNPFKQRNIQSRREEVLINGKKWVFNEIPLFFLERTLATKFGIVLPFSRFGCTVKKIAFEAADYGGDGFSDIYGYHDFINRMNQTFVLQKFNIPLIMLPQTIGPFEKESNYNIAVKVLTYAKEIYVRDGKYVQELKKLGLKYTQTKDISSYMQPEPWDINIKENSVGLNVSGLAYGNTFHGLEGQFDSYPDLIQEIINHFRNNGCTVYLIPHSYNFYKPDDNDDMVACHQAYNRLVDKSNVVLIDKDMTAPQIKYIISKMIFFIGARMHANFAAIYTGVPVFGTAYSYKFEGAFNANGLDGKRQTALLNNLKQGEIKSYISKIDKYYQEAVNHVQ